MTDYRVGWEVDVFADSPAEAAMEARRIQLDPDSDALCFDVRETYPEDAAFELVDLDDREIQINLFLRAVAAADWNQTPEARARLLNRL